LEVSGNEILQVYSRTDHSANVLASKLNTNFTFNLSDIETNADLYIISVSDDALEQMISQIRIKAGLVIHTSGFLSMDTLSQTSKNFGVLYPLQTFSISREIDMKSVPIFIEANTSINLKRIKEIAGQISDNVFEIDSDQRKKLHLAAVFACNFPNFMYSVAADLLGDAKLNFDILKPLIKETSEKVQDLEPIDAQTGPAIRGDERLIAAHIEMLNDYPAYQELYKAISKQINDYKKASK
jgi:predicted short-subunit dehydrogenase-like oxidoreductase (DUF2520 family)